jgi:CRP-like cAMP-binding protein
MNQLFLRFDQIQPLSAALKDRIRSLLIKKLVKKKDILLREGDTARYIYFIEKGVVRGFRSKNGKQKTSWIMKEGDIFLSIKSFFSQQPSRDSIEALEDCIIHCITYEQLQKLYVEFPEFNLHGRIILEHYYMLSEGRHEMREEPAFERYKFLMSNHSELLTRVPDKILASYLNMTPGTYSEQKKRFARKK